MTWAALAHPGNPSGPRLCQIIKDYLPCPYQIGATDATVQPVSTIHAFVMHLFFDKKVDISLIRYVNAMTGNIGSPFC